jgi:hypothetical protein
MEPAPRIIEKKWADTCRVLLGEEIGPINDYAKWLSKMTEPISRHKSISGKEVISAPTDYCKGAKWLSFSDVDFNRKFEPLNINEIKDMDSIASSLKERMHYAGSIVFGNSAQIRESTNINDSVGAYNVGRLGFSKYVAYTTMGFRLENCFGCNFLGGTSYCIRANHAAYSQRTFETWGCRLSSDVYYSARLNNCSDCLFSFNVWNRRHAIGNLELNKEKYSQLKKKLIGEITEELSSKKSLPTLLDIVEKGKYEKPNIPKISERIDANEVRDKSKIEDAFSKTSTIIFGKGLEGGIDSYSEWLGRHERPILRTTSASSGKEIILPNCAKYPGLPRNRILCLEEAQVHGQSTKITPEDAEELTLKNAHNKIFRVAFFNVDILEGNSSNIIEGAMTFDSSNCYRATSNICSKYCAYSFWCRNSQYIFGSDSPFESSFCINIYSCTSQTRCFEIDCCGYCTDTYFSHNCENVNDSMFCFNKKNLRYAIGNAPLPQNDYKKIKSSLLAQISDELNSTKSLRWDIYNIGCAKS